MKLKQRPGGLVSLLILILIVSFTMISFAEEQTPQVIKIVAKKFEYSPNIIKIKKGIPVILEFTSLDRTHGFTVPDLGGIRATIEPGKVTQVPILVTKTGTYEFHCDLFCGEGHEDMTGTIVVEE